MKIELRVILDLQLAISVKAVVTKHKGDNSLLVKSNVGIQAQRLLSCHRVVLKHFIEPSVPP